MPILPVLSQKSQIQNILIFTKLKIPIIQITLQNSDQIYPVSPSPTRQNIQLINNKTQSTLCWTILKTCLNIFHQVIITLKVLTYLVGNCKKFPRSISHLYLWGLARQEFLLKTFRGRLFAYKFHKFRNTFLIVILKVSEHWPCLWWSYSIRFHDSQRKNFQFENWNNFCRRKLSNYWSNL